MLSQFIKYLILMVYNGNVTETLQKRLSFGACGDAWFVVDGQKVGVFLVW